MCACVHVRARMCVCECMRACAFVCVCVQEVIYTSSLSFLRKPNSPEFGWSSPNYSPVSPLIFLHIRTAILNFHKRQIYVPL